MDGQQTPSLDRYARQLRLPELGEEGQRRLLAASVLVVGCGALGSGSAGLLARAGVGRLRVLDRDVLELQNLQRQTLFDEDDVASGLPKAVAAERRLRRINSEITVEGRVLDLTASNVLSELEGFDLVVDGTDNLETRFLLNDACRRAGRPWIYGGVLGTVGLVLVVRPDGPCLRCAFPAPPPAGMLPTCETHGVLGSAPAVVAAIQVAEALRLLVGATPSAGLLHLDLWTGSWDRIALERDPACPACAGRHDFLEARETAWVASLCGRNAVQITPARPSQLSLDELARALAAVVPASSNGFLLQLRAEGLELLLFPDGRAIVRGTTDATVARRLYTRYVGG